MALVNNKPLLTAHPQMRFVVYAIVALFLTLLNVVFVQLIAVEGVAPNLLLLMCVWVSLAEGQFAGMLFAFGIGMIFDIATSDVIGQNGLAMTLAGFVAGYFYNESRTRTNLGTPRFIFITALASLLYFLVYFTLYIQPSEITFTNFAIKNILASTLYTTVFALIPMLIYARNMDRSS